MTLSVSDVGSHYATNMRRWVKALGTGDVKRKIFLTVYRNRKAQWSVVEIAAETGIEQRQVVSKGREMAVGGLFTQVANMPVVYQKIPEVHKEKANLIRLADDKAALAAFLHNHSSGPSRTIQMSKTTNNFRNVGVANAGRMSGQVHGNSQNITLNEGAKKLVSALESFRKQLESSPVSAETKEDALAAVQDLELETKKSADGSTTARVRNAVAVLRSLAAGSTAVHQIYDQLHPFLAGHFHIG